MKEMNKESFKEFVNKESFDTHVRSWSNLFDTDSLSSQGVRKFELMKALKEWKDSNYIDTNFEIVEYMYCYCLECNIDLDTFFDID